MKRARQELAITFSFQSSPMLTALVLFAGVHPIYFYSIGCFRGASHSTSVYEVESDVVYVYAILDLRRDPLWIRKR
ncbi:MAG TPA: hypothetical protein VFT48_00780 [Pyrinomonadaceae bacterium]|nr:hypothetical protein [Pyrinomonadaceae bacterium]